MLKNIINASKTKILTEIRMLYNLKKYEIKNYP